MGGVEDTLLADAARLKADGHKVTVWWTAELGALAPSFEEAGVDLGHVRLRARVHRLGDVLALARSIRRERPDVVHAYHLETGLFGRIAATLAHVPVVAFTEANVTPRTRLQWLMERALLPRTALLIAVSDCVAAAYARQVKVDASCLTVLPSAVDRARYASGRDRERARAWLGLARRDFVYLSIARLVHAKGIDVWIRALVGLTRDMPDTRALVVGDGAARNQLWSLVVSLGLEGYVRFVGTQRDLPSLFAASDVFVLPSRMEGLPLSLLSAMAAAKPVLATAVGGVSEVVSDGVDGLLVPAEDVGALEMAARRLASDPSFRQRLAEAARHAVSRYPDFDGHARALRDLYMGALGRRA